MHPLSEKGATELGAQRILVVDDEAENRALLSAHLHRLGYRAEEAENGKVALELLQEKPFDCVLLDLNMPVLNGIETLRQLKTNRETRPLPVIVISAASDLQNAARCIAEGAEDYLPKPFNATLLKARLASSLAKKRWLDQERALQQKLQAEKERAEALLRVILPDPIAQELETTGRVAPRACKEVAVLFCDIADFTEYCHHHPPEVVLKNLQKLTERYETIALNHQMLKIKTIGDACLLTAGLLTPSAHPARQAVACGLDLLKATREHPPHWSVRVGIAQGPVIAGILGKRQFLFDIWGDTVNTASRIQEAASKNRVNVSQVVWEKLSPHAEGNSCGSIFLRGKGWMELYSVSRLLPATPPA